MFRPTSSLLRDALLALACAAALGPLQAQTVQPPAPAPAAAAPGAKDDSADAGRKNQKIERIRVDDGGATVDELRYGGQTQSITVTPKGRMPPYEVLPNSSGRSPQGNGETGTGGTGPAVWNVLKF